MKGSEKPKHVFTNPRYLEDDKVSTPGSLRLTKSQINLLDQSPIQNQKKSPYY